MKYFARQIVLILLSLFLIALSPSKKLVILSSSSVPSLSLSFTNGAGSLPAAFSFTRASTATYFDSSGTLQSAATNIPRFDYDPVSHVARGLLIEEARTNLWLQSADASNAAWAKGSVTVAVPTVTAAQAIAPDGTLTAAKVVYPAVSTVGSYSSLSQSIAVTAASYTQVVWLRGDVGGEQLYLYTTPDAITYYRQAVILTTAWQRFSLITPSLTVANWFFSIGSDRRAGGVQPATLAQTIYVWGGQVELGAFPTSYIPTTTVAVTRAIDVASLPVSSSWFNQTEFTLVIEAQRPVALGQTAAVLAMMNATAQFNRINFQGGNAIAIGDSVSGMNTGFGTPSAGSIFRAAASFKSGFQAASLNGATASVAANSPISINFTRLDIGNQGSTIPLNGYVRSVKAYTRAHNAAELQMDARYP